MIVCISIIRQTIYEITDSMRQFHGSLRKHEIGIASGYSNDDVNKSILLTYCYQLYELFLA